MKSNSKQHEQKDWGAEHTRKMGGKTGGQVGETNEPAKQDILPQKPTASGSTHGTRAGQDTGNQMTPPKANPKLGNLPNNGLTGKKNKGSQYGTEGNAVQSGTGASD